MVVKAAACLGVAAEWAVLRDLVNEARWVDLDKSHDDVILYNFFV